MRVSALAITIFASDAATVASSSATRSRAALSRFCDAASSASMRARCSASVKKPKRLARSGLAGAGAAAAGSSAARGDGCSGGSGGGSPGGGGGMGLAVGVAAFVGIGGLFSFAS